MSTAFETVAEAQAAKVLRKLDRRYAGVASRYAWDAYENHFASRRGIMGTPYENVLVLYNNNPFAAGEDKREGETERIRARLTESGMRELAYAIYPTGGDSAGYTYAMVIRADGKVDELRTIVMEETAKTFGS